jgi:dTDP-glucose pyrophosphorylase
MLNIIVPMAGRGSRFADVGYVDPKPLIDVGGKPMVQWIIENIEPKCPHRFIFICLASHLERYPSIRPTLEALSPECEIVTVREVTEGAACTVLLARDFIDDDNPLMIVNSDQYVEIDVNEYLSKMYDEKADGLIMTFWSDNPKWSYCRLGNDGLVAEVVEKQVVSNVATVGIYNFRRGSDFVNAANAMIGLNQRVNGEFYVAPVYNSLVAQGRRIVTVGTGREFEGMWGLGTPSDLELFMKSKGIQSSAKMNSSLDVPVQAW